MFWSITMLYTAFDEPTSTWAVHVPTRSLFRRWNGCWEWCAQSKRTPCRV